MASFQRWVLPLRSVSSQSPPVTVGVLPNVGLLISRRASMRPTARLPALRWSASTVWGMPTGSGGAAAGSGSATGT